MQLNGTELFVIRHGEGAPILTLHGPGFDHTILRQWLDPLGVDHELVFYDQRGCGRSRREDLSAVTDRTWVEDADAVRRGLGFEQVVVFGHSYGGCLAQEYALAYPERVGGLILCATTPAFDYAEAMMANARMRATPEQFDAILQAFGAPAKDDAAFQEAWLRITPVYFHRYHPRFGDALNRDIQFSAAASNRLLFHCLPRFSTLSRLQRIEAPTLLLAGASDWVTPADHGANRLAAGIPGAAFHMFEASGHFPFIEERDRFLSTVKGWLDRLIRI